MRPGVLAVLFTRLPSTFFSSKEEEEEDEEEEEREEEEEEEEGEEASQGAYPMYRRPPALCGFSEIHKRGGVMVFRDHHHPFCVL